MSLISRDDARTLLSKVVGYSQADHVVANLTQNNGGNIRYARNSVSTSGRTANMTLAVSSTFGLKTGVATINEFDDDAIMRTVRRAEELARLAPENPEWVVPMGPQDYGETPAYFESTASISPAFRTRAARDGIEPSAENGLVAAGFLQDNASVQSTMNSAGMFNYYRSSNVSFSATIRTPDGTGSGWVSRDFNDANLMDTGEASQIAVRKSMLSREPRALEPGRYTVILEPAASSGLVNNLVFGLNARTADEGRSFMAKPGGGTKLGDRIVDERVNIYSDPYNSEVPARAWSADGRPRDRTNWIENGVVKNLFYSRYWAQQKGVEATPGPANIIIEGGTASTEDLIASTRRGVLVTRTWYIRTVDPQTLLYTGLTRDGTFFIEDGEIKYSIKNFRFNESPIIMLNNVEEFGRPQRINGNLIPPMKIRDFSFTSLSDAV